MVVVGGRKVEEGERVSRGGEIERGGDRERKRGREGGELCYIEPVELNFRTIQFHQPFTLLCWMKNHMQSRVNRGALLLWCSGCIVRKT